MIIKLKDIHFKMRIMLETGSLVSEANKQVSNSDLWRRESLGYWARVIESAQRVESKEGRRRGPFKLPYAKSVLCWGMM